MLELAKILEGKFLLVGVALLFRKQLIDFVNGIIENLFPDASKLENNKTGTQGKLGG